MKAKLIQADFTEIEVELLQTKDGLWYRPDSSDEQMLKDSNILNKRSDYFTIDPKGKVIMDCGANIGGFINRALKLGAKKVIAYEPEPNNFDMLVINTQDLDNANYQLEQAALISSHEETVSFYLNASKRSSSSGNRKPSHKKKEYIVHALNFEKELNLHQPDLIKMDIEGGEYDVLMDFTLPDFVRELVIELHHPSKKMLKVKDQLWAQLVEQFGGEPEASHINNIIIFGKPALTVAHFQR